MYQFWLGDMLLPVTPEKVTIECGSKNSLYTCVNGDEIVFPKTSRLKVITFRAVLPNVEYPFARYNGGFQDAEYFKRKIAELKANRTPFQFVITRERNLARVYEYTDIRVIVEGYSFIESAQEGYDVAVDITLREYRSCGAVYLDSENGQSNSNRVDNQQRAKNYTVASGDSLWKIAKSLYGDGSRWQEIYNANRDKIANPNAIKVGTMLNIP